MSAKKRKLRTWSEFGDIRRRPTEYEIGTHAANYTMRKGRLAPLEQNPPHRATCGSWPIVTTRRSNSTTGKCSGIRTS